MSRNLAGSKHFGKKTKSEENSNILEKSEEKPGRLEKKHFGEKTKSEEKLAGSNILVKREKNLAGSRKKIGAKTKREEKPVRLKYFRNKTQVGKNLAGSLQFPFTPLAVQLLKVLR